MLNRFCRFQLRTTDVHAARAFYDPILGAGRADITALPVEALARGAPAHWLGHIAVADVETTLRVLLEHGATRLGPTRRTPEGDTLAIVRGPGQAVVALSTPPALPSPVDVIWSQLHAVDVARTIASYTSVFGWGCRDELDLGALGRYPQFAYDGDECSGSFCDVTAIAGVHPHWLFHFRVAAIAPAQAAVESAGGVLIGAVQLPDGSRVVVCEDPQHAVFALREPGPPR